MPQPAERLLAPQFGFASRPVNYLASDDLHKVDPVASSLVPWPNGGWDYRRLPLARKLMG